MTGLTRRALAGMGLAAAVAGRVRAGQALRIGYQKNGSLVILRRQATLEAALTQRGIAVSWAEFSAGPPILEAINAGAIDFGATGDTPPIFAQAAGVPFVYVGAQPIHGGERGDRGARAGTRSPPSPTCEASASPTRAAPARTTVVVKALATAGLTPGDIVSVLLQPPDALAAFRSGPGRCLGHLGPVPGDGGGRCRHPRAGAGDRGGAEQQLLRRPARLGRRRRRSRLPDRAGRDQRRGGLGAGRTRTSWRGLMAAVTGVPLAAQRLAAPRGAYTVQPMDERIMAQQQDIADSFARLRILPTPVDVRAAVLAGRNPA